MKVHGHLSLSLILELNSPYEAQGPTPDDCKLTAVLYVLLQATLTFVRNLVFVSLCSDQHDKERETSKDFSSS